jgi:hypothetical protein
MTQTEIYPMQPKFWHQDHLEAVFRWGFRHEGLDDGIERQQFRIQPFLVCKHVHQTLLEEVSVIWWAPVPLL